MLRQDCCIAEKVAVWEERERDEWWREELAQPSPLHDTHPSTIVTGAHQSRSQQRRMDWFEICTHHNKRSLCACVSEWKTSVVWSTYPLSHHQRTQVRAALWILSSQVTFSNSARPHQRWGRSGSTEIHARTLYHKKCNDMCAHMHYWHKNTPREELTHE